MNRVSYTNRRGITLIESTVASLLLIAALTLTIQVLASATRQHRIAERRSIALLEASNLLERAVAEFETDREPTLSPEAANRLPDAAARVEREPEDDSDGPPMIRLTATVTYREPLGGQTIRVPLSTWLADRAHVTPNAEAEPTEEAPR